MSIDPKPEQLHDSSHPYAKELDELYDEVEEAHQD